MDCRFVEFDILFPRVIISGTFLTLPFHTYILQAAMGAIPPLRPLCLVLKIFLQQRELNEVLCVCYWGFPPRKRL